MAIKNGHMITFNKSIKEMKLGEVGYANTDAITILGKTYEVYLDVGMTYRSDRFKEYQLSIKRISTKKDGFEVDFGSLYNGNPNLSKFWLTSSLEFEDMGYKEREENVLIGKLDPKASPIQITEGIVPKEDVGSGGFNL